MNIHDFADELTTIADEVGACHPVDPDDTLTFYVGDDKYEVDYIHVIRALGCGCPLGCSVELKRVEE